MTSTCEHCGVSYDEHRQYVYCPHRLILHLLKVGEVCQQLRLGPKTVRKYIQAGKLKAYALPSGQWRITEASVQACLQELHL